MKKLLIFFSIVFTATLVFLTWESLIFLNHPPAADERRVFFEVKKGDAFKRVAHRLEREGLISSSLKFEVFARINKKTGIRVGEYELSPTMYPNEVLEIITSGKSVERKMTIQEGLNKFEIAQIFEDKGLGTADDFLAVANDKNFIRSQLGTNLTSLEGYLFPETYKITKYTTAKELIKKMVGKFKSVMSKISLDKVSLNQHELVILASIIEKETGAGFERPVISSVYHNRLNKPMRLQADPTVIYGIWVETKKFKKNITKKDLRRKTPYNTYRIPGLPAGPIANPGEAALKAAAAPQSTDYLYFVSRNDGTHVFSKDYRAHVNAVRKFQLNRKAREGKSWRDLNKKKSN